MKRIFVAFVGFVTGVGFCLTAGAANLDEAVLETQDGQCRMYYLTPKNTKGWSMQTKSRDCPNGFLNGYADVVVYNAFGKIADQIYGYFSNGYWTGNYHLNAPVLKRISDEKGVQKAIFIAGSNKDLRIDYIGQMAAYKNQAGVYSPLSFCDPFRILAVTQNTDMFQDETLVQEMIDDASENARLFCPAEKRMMLFASTKMEPKQADIFFFADVDLQTGEHKIVTKGDMKPTVIKQEGGEVVSLVIPEQKRTPALKRGYVNRPTEPVVSPRPTVTTRDDFYELPESETRLTTDLMETVAPVLPHEPVEMPIVAEDVFVPEEVSPEVLAKRAALADVVVDPLPHLRVMMKVLKQPVTGTTVVHIDTISLDGSAVTDEPAPLMLHGKNFKRGWAVVSGLFTFDSDSQKGHADITDITMCERPLCKDLLP